MSFFSTTYIRNINTKIKREAMHTKISYRVFEEQTVYLSYNIKKRNSNYVLLLNYWNHKKLLKYKYILLLDENKIHNNIIN